MVKKVTGVILGLFVLSFFTHLWGNLFFLMLDSGNYIPKESSIFTFNMTEFGSGSSEAWVYGEDSSYYYFNVGYRAIIFEKNSAAHCDGFDPKNLRTWCEVNLHGVDAP